MSQSSDIYPEQGVDARRMCSCPSPLGWLQTGWRASQREHSKGELMQVLPPFLQCHHLLLSQEEIHWQDIMLSNVRAKFRDVSHFQTLSLLSFTHLLQIQ